MKKALVSGITGQAARYLIELLLTKDYEVYGMVRRTSNVGTQRVAHLLDKIKVVNGDLTDESSLIRAIEKSEPDEIYNLAAQSLVPISFEQPLLTAQVTGLGTLNFLCATKTVNSSIKFLQISSSEMFGKVQEVPQKETTRFYPRSPYASAKCFAHYTAVNYRESYDMFVSTIIAFNFESPYRGVEFVTKKITQAANQIANGKAKELRLGNLKAQRDWSHVSDVVKAMHMILQHSKPDDFVVASGEMHSVEEFLDLAFGYFNLNWKDYVVTDPNLIRPAEVDELCGDSTKIQMTLGWKPEIKFPDLVKMMIEHEIEHQ